MPEEKPKASSIVIGGLVAYRDKMPYVLIQIGTEQAQITIAEARKIAADIFQTAARFEADAMIFNFFSKNDFPYEAGVALMMEFRKLREKLDSEPIEEFISEPVNPEEVFKNPKKT